MRKGLIFLALAMAWQNATAQPFKCTDAAGKITYAGAACSELGLKDAGEVKDRVQITPAYKPPPTPPAKAAAAPASVEKPAAEPPKPERRCFTANVKGKSVTRCNDKPDEE